MSFFISTHKSSDADSSRSANSPFVGVQAKLNIGKSDDKYEREADAVADKVVSNDGILGTQPFITPTPTIQRSDDQDQEIQKSEETEQIQEKPLAENITSLSSGGDDAQPKCDECAKRERENLLVQTKCSKCEEKELQAKTAKADGSTSETSGIEQKLAGSKGGGNKMSDTTLSEMNQSFGTDFGGVNIHTDSNAVQMNRDLGARAFTNGNDIYFNSGEYNPGSKEGKHLLAHELTHTVQQGASPKGVQRKDNDEQTKLDASAEKPEIQRKEEGAEDEATVQMQLDVNAERLREERIINDNSVGSATTAENAEETNEESQEENPENENAEDLTEEADAGAENDANAGENSGESGGGQGGDVTVEAAGNNQGNCEPECYREPTEEPEEEPDEEPENPDPAQVDAEGEKTIPEDTWEEIDDCPTDQAEAAGATIEPSEGPAEGGMSEGDTATTTEGSSDQENANPESTENTENTNGDGDSGGGDGGKTPAKVGSSMEGVVSSAEAQRSTSVAAYQASSSALIGTASQNGAVKSPINFVAGQTENVKQNASRQQANNRANNFFSAIGDRLEQATSYGLEDIPHRIGATAEAAKAQIAASMEVQKSIISSRIARARGEARATAEATRQAVHTQTTNYITDVETQTAAAIETLNTTYTDTMTNIGDLETTTLEMINSMYVDARANMIALGPTIGNECKATAATMAATYRGFRNCTENGFWDGNLSQRRANAQAEAATSVGQTYYDNISDTAREQAIEVTKNGRKVDRCSIIASANQSRGTLDESLPQLIGALESTRDAAIEQARATEASLIAGIDAGLTSTLDQLDEQEYMQRQAINDTGYMQQVMQESTAHAAAAATQQGIQSAVSSVQTSLMQLKAQFSSNQAPDPQELDSTLSQVEQNINGAVDGLFTSVDTGISTAESQLNDNLQQAISSLQGITQSNEEATSQLMGAFTTGMNGISGVDNFASQRASYTAQVQQSVDSSVAALVQSYDGFQQSCDGTIAEATTRLEQSEADLEGNLRQNQEGLECEITASADEAASKEAPAWKRLLAVLIIILVVIIIIAITVFTAGAGGAALVAALGGPLLAGAIIGAVVGAVVSGLITMATNLWTNQDVMEGVGSAMLKGAITGAAGGFLGAAAGVGAGVIFQTASKGVQVAAQFGAAMISGGGFDVVTQYIEGGFSFDHFSWGQLGFTLFTTALTFGIGHVAGTRANAGSIDTDGGAPVIDGPDGTPVIDTPEATPVIDTPESAPVVDTPEATPVVDAPESTPVVDTPESNPVVDAPESTPVVDTPESTPVVDAPESNPVVDAPETTPVVDTPESNPVVDGPENTTVNDVDADVNGNKNTTDADSQNPKPISEQESIQINNDEGVVGKTPTADGHEIKVLQDGRIVKCSTCAEFKVQYEAEMNSNGKLMERFNEVDAMPNGQAKSDAIARMNNDMVAAEGYTGGAKQARQLGYPVDSDLPAGHHWRRTDKGPVLVKNSSHDGPALRYDETNGTFPPKKGSSGTATNESTPTNDGDVPENTTVNDGDGPDNTTANNGDGPENNTVRDGQESNTPVEEIVPRSEALETELQKVGLENDPMFEGMDVQTQGKVKTALKDDPIAKAGGTAQKDALEWARNGANGNPREFANRYEYARAKFNKARAAARERLAGQPNSKARAAQEAGQEITPENLSNSLNKDIQTVNDFGSRESIPAGTPSDQVPTKVQELESVGFESETAAAYHAEKHISEIPPGRQTSGDPVKDYMSAAQETISSGRVVHSSTTEGTTKVVIHKEISGRKLEAIIYVKPDGRVTLATFGKVKTDY